MYDEWEVSAHAKAMTSPLFKAAHADAQKTKTDDCLRCHAPLVAEIPEDPVATEGITCDVCHTLRDVKPTPAGSDFKLAIDDMIKFGPRCDLKDHYFHRMGCSPEHDTSQVCAACHWWEKNGVPIFTEYADWKAGPAAPTACQECHMPKSKAVIAQGSPVRDGVPHHGLLGFATDLRKRALELTASRTADGIDVALRNVNGGHHVPSGLPERRIVVTVKVGDAVQSQEFGRVLVDASGSEVPFWRATKVGSDTRIASGATAHATFAVPAGPADVTVAYRPMSAAVAKQLGQTVADEPLIHVVVTSKPVVVKPPPPGKLK